MPAVAVQDSPLVDNETLKSWLMEADGGINTSKFNVYRRKHPNAEINLAGLDASKIRADYPDFFGLDLSGVIGIENSRRIGDKLTGATLSADQLKALVKAGNAPIFNNYRECNPKVAIDLSGLDVSGSDLAATRCFQNAKRPTYLGIDLYNLDLTGVVGLERAKNLRDCDISGATFSQDALKAFVQSGEADLFNSYRRLNPQAVIDLSGIDFTNKDLRGFNLDRLDLTGVVDLHKAWHLDEASFKDAQITPAQHDAVKQRHDITLFSKERGAVNKEPSTIITDVSIARALKHDQRDIEGRY